MKKEEAWQRMEEENRKKEEAQQQKVEKDRKKEESRQRKEEVWQREEEAQQQKEEQEEQARHEALQRKKEQEEEARQQKEEQEEQAPKARDNYKTFDDRMVDLKWYKETHDHANLPIRKDKSLAQFCAKARHARIKSRQGQCEASDQRTHSGL